MLKFKDHAAIHRARRKSLARASRPAFLTGGIALVLMGTAAGYLEWTLPQGTAPHPATARTAELPDPVERPELTVEDMQDLQALVELRVARA